MKILLIEDDLDLGNGVRIALSDQGFDVIWVRRKEDALHQLDVCVPELILLDLGLPDGDGMSLMTRLRQQLKGIPVIILTARGTLQDRLCGLDAAGAYRIWKRDRFCHASPNSAQTESVCAGALGVALAGDAVYFGKTVKICFYKFVVYITIKNHE